MVVDAFCRQFCTGEYRCVGVERLYVHVTCANVSRAVQEVGAAGRVQGLQLPPRYQGLYGAGAFKHIAMRFAGDITLEMES